MVIKVIKSISVYFSLIIIWELVYKIGVDFLSLWKPYIFPSPIDVLESLWHIIKDHSIIFAVIVSMKRLLFGYFLSVIIGCTLGLLIIRFKFIGSIMKSLFLGFQTLPSVCWIPFAILWYGLSESSIIFIIVMGSVFSVSISIESAISNVYPLYIKAAKTMGAKGIKLYYYVVFPAALPAIVSALKQGWSFSWRALMAGEMLNASTGLGHILMIGRDLGDVSQVVGVMVVIIVLGLILDKIVFNKFEVCLRNKWGLDVKL
ncbi:MAG: ABC transporter permease [Clostridiaceae bacterium]